MYEQDFDSNNDDDYAGGADNDNMTKDEISTKSHTRQSSIAPNGNNNAHGPILLSENELNKLKKEKKDIETQMKTKEFQSLMPFIQNVIKEKHKEIVTRLNNHKNAVAAGANQPSSQETTPLQVPLKQRHLYNKQQSLIDEQEEEDYNNKNKKNNDNENNDDLDESQTRQIVHGNEARTTTIIRHQPSDTMILNHLENVKEHIDNQLHDYGLEISKSDDLSNLNVNINSIKTDTNNATSTNNNANNDNNDDVDENELIDDDELMTGNTKTIDNLGVWTEKDRLKLSQDQLVSIKKLKKKLHLVMIKL